MIGARPGPSFAAILSLAGAGESGIGARMPVDVLNLVVSIDEIDIGQSRAAGASTALLRLVPFSWIRPRSLIDP
jgi:hypothetical protein